LAASTLLGNSFTDVLEFQNQAKTFSDGEFVRKHSVMAAVRDSVTASFHTLQALLQHIQIANL